MLKKHKCCLAAALLALGELQMLHWGNIVVFWLHHRRQQLKQVRQRRNGRLKASWKCALIKNQRSGDRRNFFYPTGPASVSIFDVTSDSCTVWAIFQRSSNCILTTSLFPAGRLWTLEALEPATCAASQWTHLILTPLPELSATFSSWLPLILTSSPQG